MNLPPKSAALADDLRLPAAPEPIAEGRRRRLERARRLGRGKRVSYLLQYWVLRVVVGLLRLLPVDVASGFGGWIGRVFLAPRIDNETLRRTIRVAFPRADDAEARAIIVESSDNTVRVVAELAHIAAFAGPDNPRLVIAGSENVARARAGGRGVLFAVGHLANWEVSTIAVRRLGLDGTFSVMPPSNPYVFTWLARLRMSVGLSEQANAGEGVYRAFRRALRGGRAALLLADQRLGNGIKAPFFGLEATTNVVPARLARTLGIAVVPLAVRRVGRAARFEVAFLPPLEFVSSGDDAADERAFTARINSFYESEILRAPGQWLWIDPRWDEA